MRFPKFFKKEEKEEIPQEHLTDCIHDWAMVAKTFVEPKPIAFPNSIELTELSMTGMTTILFQCTECKVFKQEHLKGIETTTLDNLMVKVDISGPEYILKDGKTYILMRYVKPQENLQVR